MRPLLTVLLALLAPIPLGGCAGAVAGAEGASVHGAGLFDHVLPSDAPGETIDTLRIVATPGEYEPATFLVRAGARDLRDVGATLTALTGPGRIGADDLDLRVVKVWRQAGTTHKADRRGPVLVPEPLVYDDAESLRGSFTGSGRRAAYVPPTIARTLRTDIPAGTVKQFWLTVHVPESAPPGSYGGDVTVVTPDGPLATLRVTLEVLPFTLLEPRQSYSTSHIMDPDNPLIREELADIRRHGFRSMNLWVSGESARSVAAQLALLEEAGFEDPVALHARAEENASLAQLLERSAFAGYLQGQGEPTRLHAEKRAHSLRHHIRESYDIRQLGLRVGVPGRRGIFELLLDPGSEAYDQIDPKTGRTFRALGITDEFPDYPQYGIVPDDTGERNRAFREYLADLRAGRVEKHPAAHEAMYWQAWIERPILNRMIAGAFLWTSGLDGISAVSFQGAIGGSYGDPNDDLDSQKNSRGQAMRDNTLTYLSTDGPIPTLQWEALREGYDDMRYLTTLADLLDELRGSDPQTVATIEREIDTELRKYHHTIDHVRLDGRDFEATRALLIEKITHVRDKLATP